MAALCIPWYAHGEPSMWQKVIGPWPYCCNYKSFWGPEGTLMFLYASGRRHRVLKVQVWDLEQRPHKEITKGQRKQLRLPPLLEVSWGMNQGDLSRPSKNSSSWKGLFPGKSHRVVSCSLWGMMQSFCRCSRYEVLSIFVSLPLIPIMPCAVLLCYKTEDATSSWKPKHSLTQAGISYQLNCPVERRVAVTGKKLNWW